MAATFYVLKARYDDFQVGQERRTADEVGRGPDDDGFWFVRGRNLAEMIRRMNYEVLIDPRGELGEDRGLTVAEAATTLNLPPGAVVKMAEHGVLQGYTFPGRDLGMIFTSTQVEDVARQRALNSDDAEEASIDETGDVESVQTQADAPGTSEEEE